MFDTPAPRVFAEPPGADFPERLVAGMRARMQGQPPEAMARVTLIVNTRRMARRIRDIFDAGPPSLLPRIRLVTDVADPGDLADLPRPVSPLRQRLDLVALISQLLHQQPDLAPRASLFDLADSLAGLLAEMQGEGVTSDDIAALDVSDLSGHWARALTFLKIAQGYVDRAESAPDPEALQRVATTRLIARWQGAPPADPVIVAGSTGSRGTTALLMRAVAQLPQGAVVVPGFDFDLPASAWAELADGLTAEDHPQFRYATLLRHLNLDPENIPEWHSREAPNPARARLVSLALRPAPVTDQWLVEGPALTGLDLATKDVTLIEAPTQRVEALCIALRLRKAAECGQSAALITPDRMLSRQVTAALDRWNILPDDSAGLPLHLTPPGRFLRHVAALFTQDLTAEALITLLKHPLCHSGQDRNRHLLLTRDLELHMRRTGLPFPDTARLRDWATGRGAAQWGEWLIALCSRPHIGGDLPLRDRIDRHIALTEALAAGPDQTGAGELWDKAAGREALKTANDLRDNAPDDTALSASDYGDLFGAVLARGEVRDRDAPHPKIRIWGTLEARVQGADLVILGGLCEGTWPERPGADPWLNRRMRHDAGLLLPERRIGLAAHDFQQAIGAPEVWLTRPIRSDEAETVPSRWINRIINLMSGLPQIGAPECLAKMRQRGAHWLGQAAVLDRSDPVPSARRPSPRPPVDARPRQLSVTAIKRLIRDPYAIYAEHVLRLRPLDPLQRAPDALLRGIALHDILENFIKRVNDDPADLRPDVLLEISQAYLNDAVPWPTARTQWQARMARAALWFTETEGQRRAQAQPTFFEHKARGQVPTPQFTLTAKADRIDVDPSGALILYDYKTGNPPTGPQQKHFDKQLLLEAALATRGAFDQIAAGPVARAAFIGLGSDPKEVNAPLEDETPAETWAHFTALIVHYFDPDTGFSARRALLSDKEFSAYDHLSRFGEWEVTDAPDPQDLT